MSKPQGAVAAGPAPLTASQRSQKEREIATMEKQLSDLRAEHGLADDYEPFSEEGGFVSEVDSRLSRLSLGVGMRRNQLSVDLQRFGPVEDRGGRRASPVLRQAPVNITSSSRHRVAARAGGRSQLVTRR